MSVNYTYEQLYKSIASKGYTFQTSKSLTDDLPKWPLRSSVSLTPEQARKLIEISSLLNKNQKLRLDKSFGLKFKFSELSEDEKNIRLLPNYKVTSSSYLVKLIAEDCVPADIYINMKNPDGFGFGNENETICSELISAIGKILEENDQKLPQLDQKVWNKELPKKLKNIIDIELYDPIMGLDENGISTGSPVIVGILSTDRSSEYPDKIYIIQDEKQTGDAKCYPCTLIPKNTNDSRLLTIKPGIYEDLLSPDIHTDIGFINLIQSKSISLFSPVIVDNKIVDFTASPYNFMRVSIPVQESVDGSLLVGAKFDCTNTEDLFITDLGIDYIIQGITYVVLMDTDIGE